MSGDVAIRVEGLSKQYRLGGFKRYKTLRDSLADILRAPFRVAASRSSNEGSSQNGSERVLWALKDVSFEVKRGEVVGMIGRNGAGKSTLLKILSRITEPTTGYADVSGRVGSLLEVGTGFHPELSGRENVYLNGAILGMRKREIERKFDEIVAFAEVGQFIDTPIKYYSSGMYVRLAFAVAAHLEPEILLIDEVLAVGDAIFQQKCLGKLGDIARAGRTVLFVSHNLLAIRTMSERCMLIHEGRIVSDGDVGVVVERYLQQGGEGIPEAVDTSAWPRPHGFGTDFRLTQVRLSGRDGQARIPSRAPLVVELDFVVTQPVSQVVYGFSVYTADGARLFQCHNTNDGGQPCAKLEPGTYRVRAILETLLLPPGRYLLDVGVRCDRKSLDLLSNLMFFEVGESDLVESTWYKAQDGLFRHPCRWEAPERLQPCDTVPLQSPLSSRG